jgi:asparagine synthase (glutamine-hydrolysing)
VCGIAGILSRKDIPGPRVVLEKMLHAMVHRGPDGEGEYHSAHLTMGMRRLSIIDLQGGWQPLYNEDKSLVLVANGEIYNYLELTQALKARGHQFATHSDCEVILHLYEEYQEDCLQHLRGMFAFALYDAHRRIVILARDRMGEKPLYLHETEDTILFSSEMKSLMASGQVPFELDPPSVNDFFHYQYVPEPRTPLKGVRKLPRGHYLKVPLNTWKFEQSQYWSMQDAPPVEGDPVELIRQELDTVCGLLIRADVPVGVALSGGLDSSAIAALAAKKYPGTMHAFSVGYPGRPINDERTAAKELADLLRMPFHEIELETSDLVAHFETMNAQRDDPIADISGFGYYSVNKAARAQGIPVLLQGQGGDEVFWGYQWVKDAAEATDQRERALTDGLAPPLPPGVTQQRGTRAFIRNSLRSMLGRSGQKPPPAAPAPNQFRPIFHELAPDFAMALSDIRNYFTEEFLQALGPASAFDLFTYEKRWQHSDILITQLICDTYLLENGIAQGDRLSMANSVELRLPFVDYKLIELVIGLRKTHQTRPDFRNFPKPWLRGAMKDILPDFIIERPKQGFAPPVTEWHNELFKAYGHYLDGGYLVQSGVLTAEAGFQLSIGLFPRGAIAPISFKALVLEIWCREMQKLRSAGQ